VSRFSERVATGTTGSRLNDMAWARGRPAGRPWVTCFQSGPLGGDAQIAELVLDRRCASDEKLMMNSHLAAVSIGSINKS
jgi:methylglyoxal synthase